MDGNYLQFALLTLFIEPPFAYFKNTVSKQLVMIVIS
jgi:hypothetical protein